MAESITYRAVMELKTYTITIRSGKSSGESKTYTVSHGSSWSFPSCPFSPDSGKAFSNYTLNGSTYSAGSSVTITSNLSITCNWVLTNPVGKSLKIRNYKTRDIGFAYELLSYDPELEGMTFRYIVPASWGINITHDLVIARNNLNSRQVVTPVNNITETSYAYGQISQTTNFEGRPFELIFEDQGGMYVGTFTSASGELVTVTYRNQ